MSMCARKEICVMREDGIGKRRKNYDMRTEEEEEKEHLFTTVAFNAPNFFVQTFFWGPAFVCLLWVREGRRRS